MSSILQLAVAGVISTVSPLMVYLVLARVVSDQPTPPEASISILREVGMAGIFVIVFGGIFSGVAWLVQVYILEISEPGSRVFLLGAVMLFVGVIGSHLAMSLFKMGRDSADLENRLSGFTGGVAILVAETFVFSLIHNGSV